MSESKPLAEVRSNAGLGPGVGGRDYLGMLHEGYAAINSFSGGEAPSRLEYLSDYIFDFTTYDSEIAELFARRALEVCAAISNATTYEYIKDAEQYRWYLVMCNMPFFAGRLDWGTSIRGAWWQHEGTEFSTCGLWGGGQQITDLKFTREQWVEFIAAVLAFGAEEPNVKLTGAR